MSGRPVPPTQPELEANLTRLWGEAQPRPAFVAELERELRASQPIPHPPGRRACLWHWAQSR